MSDNENSNMSFGTQDETSQISLGTQDETSQISLGTQDETSQMSLGTQHREVEPTQETAPAPQQRMRLLSITQTMLRNHGLNIFPTMLRITISNKKYYIIQNVNGHPLSPEQIEQGIQLLNAYQAIIERITNALIAIASNPEYINQFLGSEMRMDLYLLVIFKLYIANSAIFSEIPPNYTSDKNLLRYYFLYVLRVHVDESDIDEFANDMLPIYQFLSTRETFRSVLELEPHVGQQENNPIGTYIPHEIIDRVVPNQAIFDDLRLQSDARAARNAHLPDSDDDLFCGRKTKRKSKKRKRSKNKSNKNNKNKSKNKRRKL